MRSTGWGTRFFKLMLLNIAWFFFVVNLFSQDHGTRQPKPLFQTDAMLYLTLEADFKTVFSVTDDSTYFPARMTLKDNTGLEKTIDLEVRTRGKTRREKDVCTFTPLRLRFPKKESRGTPFEGQRAIKLVTHCKNPDRYEQNTIIEYLVYRTYNLLTDSSFFVRPAIIDYIFQGNRPDTVRKFAFFLEREKHLAARLQGIELEDTLIHPNRLDPLHTCQMDMFQYMIGNTDYSIYKLHNIILVTDSSQELKPVAIPYDFDWCGLVSASYAVPHPLINTEYVAERVYRGFKKDMKFVEHTRQTFLEKKKDFYQLFENNELLFDKEKKQAIKYLDEFYKTLSKDKMVKYEFYDNARVVHN